MEEVDRYVRRLLYLTQRVWICPPLTTCGWYSGLQITVKEAGKAVSWVHQLAGCYPLSGSVFHSNNYNLLHIIIMRFVMLRIHHKYLFVLSELCSGVLWWWCLGHFCFYASSSHTGNEIERMLSIGSLISCWHFSQPWRHPLKNRILVMCISLTSGYLTLQTKALYLCFSLSRNSLKYSVFVLCLCLRV